MSWAPTSRRAVGYVRYCPFPCTLPDTDKVGVTVITASRLLWLPLRMRGDGLAAAPRRVAEGNIIRTEDRQTEEVPPLSMDVCLDA